MNIFGKRSDLPFSRENDHAWFRLRMSRILFAAKHSWTTLRMSRPLFLGSYLQVTWWAFSQWKGRKICIEMIISFIVLQFSQIILYYSLLNLPRWLNTVTGDETGLTSQLGSIVRTLFTYNTNRNRTVNYPFCSPQQYLNNLQYQKTIKYGTRKSTLCTSWLFFASKYGIFFERKCCM